MIEICKIDMKADMSRLGLVYVKYYDLVLRCEICIWKKEKLWIRLPQLWVDEKTKICFNFWETQELSDAFQKEVLNKVFDKIGLTVETGIKMRKDFFSAKNTMTLKNKKTNFTKKNSKL